MALSNRINFRGGQNVAPTNLLGQIDSLLLTNPSDSTQASSTKRTWIKNSLVKGLEEDNYYASTAVSSYSTSGNTCTYYNSGAYGIGLVTNCEANKSYSVSISAAGQRPRILYYGADGSYIGRFGVSNDGTPSTFTVPANAEYVIILVYNTSTSGVFTLNELKIA